MADSTIATMTAASTLDGTELLYGVQGGADRKVTGAQIKTLVSASPTLVTPNLGTPSAGVLTSATGLPLTTGVTGTLPVANGGTGVTSSTGSGANALATSPTLVTPVLGTPTSGTLTNCTGLPVSTGVSGLGTGVATALAVAVGSAGAAVVNSATNQSFTGGIRPTAYDIGTITTGTVTPDSGNGPIQKLTANGAFTLAAPANDGGVDLMITNGASAGTITFSSFTKALTGDTFATTSGNKYLITIRRINSISFYQIVAMQ